MYDHFAPLSLYGDDLRGEKRVYPLFGFHRDFGSDGIVTNQGILHITEKTLFVQRFGEIAEHVKAHCIV